MMGDAKQRDPTSKELVWRGIASQSLARNPEK
jgi:hypothetical protein